MSDERTYATRERSIGISGVFVLIAVASFWYMIGFGGVVSIGSRGTACTAVVSENENTLIIAVVSVIRLRLKCGRVVGNWVAAGRASFWIRLGL